MGSPDDLLDTMKRRSDSELLDIVEGRDLGYREEAVRVAQRLLRGRGVEFQEVDPSTLTAVTDAMISAVDEEEELLARRRHGRSATAAGAALFVLPFLGFGQAFGWTTPFVALGLVVGGLFVSEQAERELSDRRLPLAEDLAEMPAGGPSDVRGAMLLFVGFLILLVLFSMYSNGVLF